MLAKLVSYLVRIFKGVHSRPQTPQLMPKQMGLESDSEDSE